jgi:D-alanyl-lipoteichoic acid acyltransferase DltB (MBOAT superfamily)
VLFAFQIYGDFSGYSDIALGTAKLFGIDLLRNFAYPYFSRDIAEFWRRWHISLSSWFRDYLYIPLGGSKGGMWMKVRNTFIIFLVSGFWHGASWNFIIWGFLNALYIMPSIVFNTNRNNLDIVSMGKLIPSIRDVFSMIITFSLTTFAWIFFRANGVKQALDYLSSIFSKSLFTIPQLPEIPYMKEYEKSPPIFILLIVFILIEWIGREQNFAIANLGVKLPRVIRWSIYYVIIVMVFFFSGKEQQFIYFQF